MPVTTSVTAITTGVANL